MGPTQSKLWRFIPIIIFCIGVVLVVSAGGDQLYTALRGERCLA